MDNTKNKMASRQQTLQNYAVLAEKALSMNELIPGITQSVPDCTVQEAYSILFQNVSKRAEKGDLPVGYKVGVLTPPAQKMMHIAQPAFGIIFQSMVHNSETALDFDTLNRPTLEVEIALRVDRNICEPIDTCEDAYACIKDAVLAFEIADGRLLKPPINAADLIADYTAARAVVLGGYAACMMASKDLAEETVSLYRNGNLLRVADTNDVGGNPLKPFIWLANQLLAEGHFLRKGDLVMSGALLATSIAKGDRFKAIGKHFGQAAVSF